jgi:hypothetical protein
VVAATALPHNDGLAMLCHPSPSNINEGIKIVEYIIHQSVFHMELWKNHECQLHKIPHRIVNDTTKILRLLQNSGINLLLSVFNLWNCPKFTLW